MAPTETFISMLFGRRRVSTFEQNTMEATKGYHPTGKTSMTGDDGADDGDMAGMSSLLPPPPPPPPRKLERSSTAELEMIERGPVSTLSKRLSLDEMSTDSQDSLLSSSSLSSTSPSLVEQCIGDDDEQLALIAETSPPKIRTSKATTNFTEAEVEKYMARREMTPLQERVNAITVMPGAFYCLLFLVSGSWLQKSLIEETSELMNSSDFVFDQSSCISSGWFPHLHAMPPLPVIAGAFGIIVHAPFSFLYHWHYAHRLPPGLARTTHWSRRMDQAMIHFCSISMSYATSGRLDFFLVNCFFNLDCMYRHFKSKVHPRRNKIRLLISVIAYTIPILRRGDMILFGQIWASLGLGFWLFATYPIGGWSHAAFHLVVAIVPPLLMASAIHLPASQEQLKIAAQCAVIAARTLGSR